MGILQKIFGRSQQKALAPVSSRGWYPLIREPSAGAWQRNQEIRGETVNSHFAVYSCITLISQDIGKVPFVLKQRTARGVWKPATIPNINRILRNPNQYQNGMQFREHWMNSKLSHGNAYGLKQRDAGGYVTALHILDPYRVQPLVSESGDIYYKLSCDNLAGLGEDGLVVPASEIIHDRMSSLYHPLVGISPLSACALSAANGLEIIRNSKDFFANGSNPGGILTAVGEISDKTAEALKAYFEENFTGSGAGSIAVVGDGMKYESLGLSAVDAQLIDQLKFTAEVVCAAFHVPPFMVLGTSAPNTSNIEAQTVQFYNQSLQYHIEAMENLLDDALELRQDTSEPYGIELDISQMFRMDTASRYKSHSDAIGGGWMTPNEARLREDLDPIEGGDSAYMQVQNYSLSALYKRDSAEAEDEGITQGALDSTQLSTLQGVLTAAAADQIPPDTAEALLTVAFPQMTAQQIKDLLEPIRKAAEEKAKEPPPAAPLPPGQQGQEGAAPPEGEPAPEDSTQPSPEDQVRAMLEQLTDTFNKGLTHD